MQEPFKTVFQVLSYLLTYPDDMWYKGLHDCLEAKKYMPEQICEKMEHFIDAIRKMDENERIQSYVDTFDFGKKTNLYVTYHNLGEQRERGFELIALKQAYQKAGFEPTERELPDYLPLMLEFASLAEEHQVALIFGKYLQNIRDIQQRLIEAESIYQEILHALLLVLREIGIGRKG